MNGSYWIGLYNCLHTCTGVYWTLGMYKCTRYPGLLRDYEKMLIIICKIVSRYGAT